MKSNKTRKLKSKKVGKTLPSRKRGKAIVVRVTRRHISTGSPGDVIFCPIALAVKERCKAKWTCVSEGEIDVHRIVPDGEIRDRYFTPSKAQVFMRKFDNGKKVKPFKFQLRKVRQ